MLELMGIFMCVILIGIVLFWIIWLTGSVIRLDDKYDEFSLRVRSLENHALNSKPIKIKTKGRSI